MKVHMPECRESSEKLELLDLEVKGGNIFGDSSKGDILGNVLSSKKIRLFLEWLQEIIPFKSEKKKYVYVSFVKQDKKELFLEVNVYTRNFTYSFYVVDSKRRSYLGSRYFCRKAYPGEEDLRGNDLPDGKLERKTWQSIKSSIICNELVNLYNTAL